MKRPKASVKPCLLERQQAGKRGSVALSGSTRLSRKDAGGLGPLEKHATQGVDGLSRGQVYERAV